MRQRGASAKKGGRPRRAGGQHRRGITKRHNHRWLAIVHHGGGQSRLEYPIGKVVYQTPGWISHIRFSPQGNRIAFLDHPFPQDDSGYGFDNNGDALSVSPLLMEKYMQAADTIVAKAVPTVSLAALSHGNAEQSLILPGTSPAATPEAAGAGVSTRAAGRIPPASTGMPRAGRGSRSPKRCR